MSSPVQTTARETPVADVAETLLTKEIGSVVVGDIDGIATKTDLLRAIQADGISAPVGTVMTELVITVTPNATVQTAVNRMQEQQIKHLVVETDGEPVGIVTTSDLAARLATVPDSISSMFATSSNPNQLNRYECANCGRRVTADTQPKQCTECGGATRNISVARD